MPFNRERKLIFCHIPRTGGVSVCNALNMEIIGKHFPVSAIRHEFPKDYILFSIQRPYLDRIKSAHGYILPDDFYTWEELMFHYNKQTLDDKGLIVWPNEYFLDAKVDYLLRFENLQEDLDKMLSDLKQEKVVLIKCNSFKKIILPIFLAVTIGINSFNFNNQILYKRKRYEFRNSIKV